MTEEVNKGGRPLKYESAEELQSAVDEYFKSLKDDKGAFYIRPPTVSGLALHLDISTRSLLDYGKGVVGNKEFPPIVSRAKQRCESFLEEAAITGKTKNPISLLSMNFGRYEKREIDLNHKGNIVDDILAARKRAGVTILTEEKNNEEDQ